MTSPFPTRRSSDLATQREVRDRVASAFIGHPKVRDLRSHVGHVLHAQILQRITRESRDRRRYVNQTLLSFLSGDNDFNSRAIGLPLRQGGRNAEKRRNHGAGEPKGHAPNAPSIVHIVHRSEEHTSELQSLMRISYAVFCLKKKKIKNTLSSEAKH